MLATRDASASSTRPQVLLHIYQDARRREDQWRIPQHLLAFATPILVFMAVLLAHGNAALAIRAGAVGMVTATGAALFAIKAARWHRTSDWIANKLRTEYPLEPDVLRNGPL